jgi:putative ABC transport system substrate-binding protein
MNQVQRRRFLIAAGKALGACALAPALVHAQRLRRVGLLSPSPAQVPYFDALRKELAGLGHVEGQHIVFEMRNAEGKLERLSELARELVGLKVEIIVVGSNPAVVAAQQATRSIPIVFGTAADPVGSGFVASLARPGGNTTGVSNVFEDVVVKNLELLMAMVPKIGSVAALRNPQNATHARVSDIVAKAARGAGLALLFLDAPTPDALDRAFAAAAQERAGGVMVLADPFMNNQRAQIAQLAIKHGLPTALPTQDYVAAGGLMSYGPSYIENFRRAAAQVDKILKGVSPAELPVELSNRFELTLNRKTARSLGLNFPPELTLRADRVIE